MYNPRNPFFYTQPFQKHTPYAMKFTSIKKETNPNLDSPQPDLPPKRHANVQKEELLFEIFGIKIYFDDLLIICILLFLYQEGIEDEYLFITLILLLIS